MRWILIGFAVLTLAIVATLGFRGSLSSRRPLMLFWDMKFQPRYHAQGSSAFFADGRSMRTPPTGTVPFGGADYESDAGAPRQDEDMLQAADDYYRGKKDGKWVKRAPIEIDLKLLRQGQKSYNTHCAVCHGPAGRGNGITTQYGLVGVATYHDDRLRNMPDGEIYNTIVNGKGAMQGYGHQVRVRDRWAIVAYIRALQRSQNARLADVPEPYLGTLDGAKP